MSTVNRAKALQKQAEPWQSPQKNLPRPITRALNYRALVATRTISTYLATHLNADHKTDFGPLLDIASEFERRTPQYYPGYHFTGSEPYEDDLFRTSHNDDPCENGGYPAFEADD